MKTENDIGDSADSLVVNGRKLRRGIYKRSNANIYTVYVVEPDGSLTPEDCIRVSDVEDALKEQHRVHAMTLRGTIAKLSDAQVRHVYPHLFEDNAAALADSGEEWIVDEGGSE